MKETWEETNEKPSNDRRTGSHEQSEREALTEVEKGSKVEREKNERVSTTFLECNEIKHRFFFGKPIGWGNFDVLTCMVLLTFWWIVKLTVSIKAEHEKKLLSKHLN